MTHRSGRRTDLSVAPNSANFQLPRSAGRARTVRRSILAFAGLALVATLLLAILPTRGGVIIEGGEVIAIEVNCGTVFANTRWSDADDCDGPILLRFVATLIGLASPSYLGARGWFSSRYKPVGDAKASLATTGPRDVPDVVPRPLRRQHVSPARRRYRSGTRALAWREPGSSSQASWRSTIDVSSAGRPPVTFRRSLPLWSRMPEAISCGLYRATYRTRKRSPL